MLISDWSSDVCASDLILILGLICVAGFTIWSGCRFYLYNGSILYGVAAGFGIGATYAILKQISLQRTAKPEQPKRSEERRVGQECVRPCTYRGGECNYKHTTLTKEQLE